jgi:hypothetical protein
MRSAIRHRMRPRSDPGIVLQGPEVKAFRAACTARSMSAAPPSATSVSGSSVAGLKVVKVAPFWASAHWPSMNRRAGRSVGGISVDMEPGCYSVTSA